MKEHSSFANDFATPSRPCERIPRRERPRSPGASSNLDPPGSWMVATSEALVVWDKACACVTDVRSIHQRALVRNGVSGGAQHQGFTRAAERLHLTRSAVSLLVRELESQLGVRLFDRTTMAPRAPSARARRASFESRCNRARARSSKTSGLDLAVAPIDGR